MAANDDGLPEPGVLGDAAARHITGRLNGVAGFRLRVQALTLADPHEGSVAAAEMNAEPEVERAYIHARALLVCALDHLETLRVLVVDARFVPAMAHFTLLRGALEPALQARWVLAGGARDRLARGFALELDDLDERRKFEDALGHGELARRRIDELLVTAADLGLTTHADSGAPRLTVPVMGYIDLLKVLPRADPHDDSQGDDSWVYRFLSGYAHAKVWATTLGVQAMGARGAVGGVGRVETTDAYVVEMVERVWLIVGAAIDEVERLWSE